MKRIIKKTFPMLFAALTILIVSSRAAAPMDKYWEIVFRMNESEQVNQLLLEPLEKNLIKNGWVELSTSSKKTVFHKNLGVINGKYRLFYRITMYKSGWSAKEIYGSIGLNDGSKYGNLAVVRKWSDSEAVDTIAIADTVVDYLNAALKVAAKCMENSITNINQVLRDDNYKDDDYNKNIEHKSKITLNVSSDGTPWINIETISNAPIQVAMDDAKTIITVLQTKKSELDAIAQATTAEAREAAVRQMAAMRDSSQNRSALQDKELPELNGNTIAAYFTSHPKMRTEILNQARELVENNDYDEALALCRIIQKGPREIEIDKEARHLEMIVSSERQKAGRGNLSDGGVRSNLGIFNISELDKVPETRGYRRAPDYPYELMRRNIEGEAVLEFIVDAHGDVRDVNVVSSTHREFESPAIQAVQKWKFSPGRKGGKAVNTRMRIPVAFTLSR